MSKLLIPRSGNASEDLKGGVGSGGAILGPGASLVGMKYDIKGGCIPYGISSQAGTWILHLDPPNFDIHVS